MTTTAQINLVFGLAGFFWLVAVLVLLGRCSHYLYHILKLLQERQNGAAKGRSPLGVIEGLMPF